MARINLDRMSIKDLVKLQADIEGALAAKRIEEKDAVKAKIAALAAEAGFSVGDLFGGRGGKRGKAAAKYRNPDNAEETWTGRGRKPNWMVALLKKGAKMDKFLIA